MFGRRSACQWYGCPYTIQNKEHNALLVLIESAKVIGSELL